MMRRPLVRLGLLAGVWLVAPRTGPAQGIAVTTFGIIGGPRSTVLNEGVRETVGGVWLGVAVEVKVRRLLIAVSGLRGTLTPIENTPFERDGGEEAILIRFEPRSGLGVEGAYTARAFSSAAGYQHWDILGLGAWVSMPLGDPALCAYARGSYLPAVSVSGQPAPTVALAAEVGVSAAPARAPVLIRLKYRFERFDFPGQPTARLEEFDRITLEVGYRVRR